MFTDFSQYIRQPKNIFSLGSMATEGIASGDISGGVNTGIGVRAGRLEEGERGVEFQLQDGSWVSYVNTDSDLPPANEPDPNPPPQRPEPREPRRGDPDWKEPSPPRPRPPTEEEKRQQRQRDAEQRARDKFETWKQEQKARQDASKGKSGGSGGGGGGGAPRGGQPKGGQPTGGQPTGGQPTGGQPTGGQPRGGQPIGGEKSGVDFSGKQGGSGSGHADFGVPKKGGGLPDMEEGLRREAQRQREEATGGWAGATSSGGWGSSSMSGGTTWGGGGGGSFQLQPTPAYSGQSGSNPAQYPSQGNTSPFSPTGSDPWITNYNSQGYMSNDPVRGGSYFAPATNVPQTGTNPATQVGISYPSQQSNYDTFSNVTGAGSNMVYAGGSPSFDESTGQYKNVVSNPITKPNTIPTSLSSWDLFGTAGASSGLFLDTPTIKQNGVSGIKAVDAKATPVATTEPSSGLGLVAMGLIALKLLSAAS